MIDLYLFCVWKQYVSLVSSIISNIEYILIYYSVNVVKVMLDNNLLRSFFSYLKDESVSNDINLCLNNILSVLPYPMRPLSISEIYLFLQLSDLEILLKIYQVYIIYITKQYVIDRLEAFIISPGLLYQLPIFQGYFIVNKTNNLFDENIKETYCEIIGTYFYQYDVYIYIYI